MAVTFLMRSVPPEKLVFPASCGKMAASHWTGTSLLNEKSGPMALIFYFMPGILLRFAAVSSVVSSVALLSSVASVTTVGGTVVGTVVGMVVGMVVGAIVAPCVGGSSVGLMLGLRQPVRSAAVRTKMVSRMLNFFIIYLLKFLGSGILFPIVEFLVRELSP